MPGGRPNDGQGKSREGSIGSQEGIQLSEIKIITKHHDSEERRKIPMRIPKMKKRSNQKRR